MTPKVLTALKKSSKLSKKYYANPSLISKEQLNTYSKHCSQIVISTKDKFLNKLSEKLGDPNTSTKSHWFIMKNF